MSKNEIEIKLPLKNLGEVAKFLDKHGEFSYENHQIDTYYDDNNLTWTGRLDGKTPIDFWLRVREEGEKSSLNFKNYTCLRRADVSSCAEFESDIAKPNDVKNILQELNYQVIAIVDKIRRAYKFHDCEIALDSVENLGDFIEIEYYGTEENVNEICDLLNSVRKEIGAKTGSQDNLGYPYLLMRQNRAKRKEAK